MGLTILLGALALGTWLSWRDIENGSGWVCGRLSNETLQKLNKKENLWKKILLAVVLGYITVMLKAVEWIIKFVMRMVDGSLFHI